MYFIQSSLHGDYHRRAYNVKKHVMDLYSAIPGTAGIGVPDLGVEGPDRNMWLGSGPLYVYLWREISSVPASIEVQVGQSAPLAVSEKNTNQMQVSAISNDPSIATVSGSEPSFSVTGVSTGSTSITLSDPIGNILNVPVTVN